MIILCYCHAWQNRSPTHQGMFIPRSPFGVGRCNGYITPQNASGSRNQRHWNPSSSCGDLSMWLIQKDMEWASRSEHHAMLQAVRVQSCIHKYDANWCSTFMPLRPSSIAREPFDFKAVRTHVLLLKASTPCTN